MPDVEPELRVAIREALLAFANAIKNSNGMLKITIFFILFDFSIIIFSDRIESAESAASTSSDVEMTDVSSPKDKSKRQNYLDDSQKTLIIALLEKYC